MYRKRGFLLFGKSLRKNAQAKKNCEFLLPPVRGEGSVIIFSMRAYTKGFRCISMYTVNYYTVYM